MNNYKLNHELLETYVITSIKINVSRFILYKITHFQSRASKNLSKKSGVMVIHKIVCKALTSAETHITFICIYSTREAAVDSY